MSEIEVKIAPSGAHPTASVTNKILNSGAATTTATGFKAGSLDTGGSGYQLITSVFGNLPDKKSYGSQSLVQSSEGSHRLYPILPRIGDL